MQYTVYCISISLDAEPVKSEEPELQTQVPPQGILAPPPVPGMPLPPGLLPFPHGFPVPGLPPPGIMPPFGMGIPPPGMPPGLPPRMPENINPRPMFDQRLRPDVGKIEKSQDDGPQMKDGETRQNQGHLNVVTEPDRRFPGPAAVEQGPNIPRPGFPGNRPVFDGMRPRFDGPRPGFDGVRPGFEGPRREFDGLRPRLDGPRPGYDGPVSRFDGPPPGFRGPPPWAQQRARFPIGKQGVDREPDTEIPANDKKEAPPESHEPSQDPSSLSWRSHPALTDKEDDSKKELQGKSTDNTVSDVVADDRIREREERDRGRERGRPWDRERDRGGRGGRGMEVFF